MPTGDPTAQVKTLESRLLLDWLARHGPAEWHCVATGWNWDAGVAPLEWIVRHDDCDAGTASFVFWTAVGPSGALDAADGHAPQSGEYRALSDLALGVLDQWRAGRYASRLFANDPGREAAALARANRNPAFRFDTDIATPITGEAGALARLARYDGRYDEGIPATVSLDAYRQLGIAPPAWLTEPPRKQSPLERFCADAMTPAELAELRIRPDRFDDFADFRKFLDTVRFTELAATAREQRAAGVDFDATEAEKMHVLARMSAPFDEHHYPEYWIGKATPKRAGLWTKLFGSGADG